MHQNKSFSVRENDGINYPRSLIFELTAQVGGLSSIILHKLPLDPPIPDAATSSVVDEKEYKLSRQDNAPKDDISASMARILLTIIKLSHSLSVNLESSVIKKMKLNAKKYPAELVRGKSGKYTKYTDVTGISKEEGQSTLHMEGTNSPETVESFLDSIDSLTMEIRSFATDREWSRFHLPRNLALALIGELGELAELFQWRGDHAGLESISNVELDKIGQELADVTIYLLRLADVCHYDLCSQTKMLLSGDEA